MKKRITFDFNNMFSSSVGNRHGVNRAELKNSSIMLRRAAEHLNTLIKNKDNRVRLGLEWIALPFQSQAFIASIQKLGNKIARKYENVLFLGIGGSYLGLKAAQDALMPPYYNEFASLRKQKAKIYFEGNNLDPDTLQVLLKNLNPEKTFVIVISKSGETTETRAAFVIVEAWLKKGVGKYYGRQIFAITDPSKGALRRRVNAEHAKDVLSFCNLPLLEGVGGRYSEFNIGLLHLAIVGINLKDLFSGLKQMASRCLAADIYKNPAYLYAALQHLLYKKGKSIAIVMPFSEGLKSTADWYVQLLAESLGKKYERLIVKRASGQEFWKEDKNKIVNCGRTPVPCRGTADLHSVQQNLVEGQNNKTVTFIKVEKFKKDLQVIGTGDFLSGKSYSRLLSLAQEATEWALVSEQRPNCTIVIPELNAFYWGQLLYFFQMATAFEGELLNVNAFDQPGVESYKQYMYCKLKKPQAQEEIADKIKKHPLLKKKKLII